MVSFDLTRGSRAATSAKLSRDIEQNLVDFVATVTRFDQLMIQADGGPALSPQAYLVLTLLIHGPMAMKDAMLHNPLSYRAFYNMLDKLKKHSIITVEIDDGDRRVRRLVLSPKCEPIRAYLSLC
jgi:DNA-binding MarR family transcriptional regulator